LFGSRKKTDVEDDADIAFLKDFDMLIPYLSPSFHIKKFIY
jgi:hypothetical protein